MDKRGVKDVGRGFRWVVNNGVIGVGFRMWDDIHSDNVSTVLVGRHITGWALGEEGEQDPWIYFIIRSSGI